MCKIYERKSLVKSLSKVPRAILQHYEIWKRIIEHEGHQGLPLIKGFDDEALNGEWEGYRSSRLTIKWRVIYKLEKDVFEIYVIDINPHDYKG